MTTPVLDSSCMFCGRPARRRPAPGENPAHDFDCVHCGRYRVGETAEARMRGVGASRYQAVLPEIMWANREGFRLIVPSCFRVPLNEERAVPLVARADHPVNQPEHGEAAPRPAAGKYSPTPPSSPGRAERHG